MALPQMRVQHRIRSVNMGGVIGAFHPDTPKMVGFWDESNRPQDRVDPTWNLRERAIVLGYLKTGRESNAYKGSSWCRFKCHGLERDGLGSCDLTDGTWIWPEGFAHYVEMHNVKPPIEFVQYVLTKYRP